MTENNDNIVSLADRRALKDRADPEFIMVDQDGREMQCYSLEYEMSSAKGTGSWSAQIWAYSFDDAEARVAAMKETLRVSGQVISVVPV